VIRHVSVLTFVEGVRDEQIAAVSDALATLPGRIPIHTYSFGPDLGLAEGNAEYVVVADFPDADAYRVYRDDEEHQRILREVIKPILSSRAAAQYVIVPDPPLEGVIRHKHC
jgi:hypothetical protein